MKKTKLEPKIHEFRSAILFIKKIEEHKPKKKKKKNIIQTQKIKHKNTRKSNPEKS